MTLAIGWPHERGENPETWPHEGGVWHGSAVDVHGLMHDGRWRAFCTFFVLDVSGRHCHVISVVRARSTGGFRRGRGPVCLRSSGKLDCSDMTTWPASTGPGSRWTEPRRRLRSGEKKTGRNPTDRGKLGAKRSLLTDARGVPIGLAIDGANRHDCKLVEATLQSIPVARPAPDAGQIIRSRCVGETLLRSPSSSRRTTAIPRRRPLLP